VPAESIYAVFEVKQELNLDTIVDAAAKALSVRRLRKTTVASPHAGGKYPPKLPLKILRTPDLVEFRMEPRSWRGLQSAASALLPTLGQIAFRLTGVGSRADAAR
jgi:hypothetical protein